MSGVRDSILGQDGGRFTRGFWFAGFALNAPPYMTAATLNAVKDAPTRAHGIPATPSAMT